MSWYMLLLSGVVGGVIGGMGMGGGTLLIPILTMAIGFSQLQAQAINLVSFVPMAVVSLLMLIKNKLIDVKSLILVTPLAVVGCVLGAAFSEKIGENILRKTFGAFMLGLGVLFFAKAILGLVGKLIQSHREGNAVKKAKKATKNSFN